MRLQDAWGSIAPWSNEAADLAPPHLIRAHGDALRTLHQRLHVNATSGLRCAGQAVLHIDTDKRRTAISRLGTASDHVLLSAYVNGTGSSLRPKAKTITIYIDAVLVASPPRGVPSASMRICTYSFRVSVTERGWLRALNPRCRLAIGAALYMRELRWAS